MAVPEKGRPNVSGLVLGLERTMAPVGGGGFAGTLGCRKNIGRSREMGWHLVHITSVLLDPNLLCQELMRIVMKILTMCLSCKESFSSLISFA